MADNSGKTSTAQFFNQEMAAHYDERNSRLAEISDSLHFLVRLVLADLPSDARILCIGVGTGAEILSLARTKTNWSFVGVDPSAPMLERCRARLKHAGLLDRCELLHGYAHDLPEGGEFDAVLSILVAHFIERDDRIELYRSVHDRLKPGGYFISAEISFDFDSPEFPEMLKNWGRVHTLMGATPDALQKLHDQLRNTLCVLPPAETEALLKNAGFALPVQFFQAVMIRGWHARK